MKKILENNYYDFFNDGNNENVDINYLSSIDDINEYSRVKAIYDSLINCNKDMVYRDSKHWYIQID